MTLCYNLLDEPWLRCVQHDGGQVELSLPEALARAHDLRGLAGDSPLEVAALTRLLLAVLHRSFEVADEADWLTVYHAEKFDHRRIERYLAAWHSRFDLFDAERPFYQVPGLTLKSKPARELIPEQSTYGAPRDLFEHRPANHQHTLFPGVAARLLCRIQGFHLGGTISGDRKAGDPTSARMSPLARVAVTLIMGATLHETLALNLLPSTLVAARVPTTTEDAPAWERPPPITPGPRACCGWLDLLTWQSRRLLLLPQPGSDDAAIDSVVVAGGFDLDVPEGFCEPMAAYRTHDKLGLVPLTFRPDRTPWRDATVLIGATRAEEGGHRHRAPLTVEAVQGRVARGTLPRSGAVDLMLVGQFNNKAKLILTRTERLPIAARLFGEPELTEVLTGALRDTNLTAQALRRAVRAHAANTCHSTDKKTLTSVVDSTQATARFWAAMKPCFDALMAQVGEDEDQAFEGYARSLRHVALHVFDHATDGLGSGAAALRGAVVGRSQLVASLRQLEDVSNPA